MWLLVFNLGTLPNSLAMGNVHMPLSDFDLRVDLPDIRNVVEQPHAVYNSSYDLHAQAAAPIQRQCLNPLFDQNWYIIKRNSGRSRDEQPGYGRADPKLHRGTRSGALRSGYHGRRVSFSRLPVVTHSIKLLDFQSRGV